MNERIRTVHLIPHGMIKLPQFQLRECQACIQTELRAVADASDSDLQFAVSLATQNATKVSANDFPIYLLQGNRLSSAITLAKNRMPEYFDSNRGALPMMSKQLQVESSASVVAGGTTITFVAIDKYLEGEGSNASVLQQQKHQGRELGHTILHELAHCMGIDTDDYYDDLMKPGFPGRNISAKPQPSLRFNPSTREKIINHLTRTSQ